MAFVLETEATKRPNSGAQSIWLKFTGEGYTVQVSASFEMATCEFPAAIRSIPRSGDQHIHVPPPTPRLIVDGRLRSVHVVPSEDTKQLLLVMNARTLQKIPNSGTHIVELPLGPPL